MARPVLLARRPLVEQQRDTFKRNGLVKRIQHSEWTASIVTPMKRDNTVRIIGDFKMTMNPQLDIDSYPLPRIDDIFARLSGGRQFSVLHLQPAYLKELEKTQRNIWSSTRQKDLINISDYRTASPLRQQSGNELGPNTTEYRGSTVLSR
ncbi:uncharacterized protein LOC134194998 [Corticium candelabrum]|uniref:uncharacterized protein LOC134194998 n=1 Tax=Corticium candelabrum TaxID=121492 RepID=UPI002E262DB5|nr:uncharacterized protein LOC134194998 [Corticium candelabrum]